MLYNLHFYKEGKLQEIIKSKTFMYGRGNKFLSCVVPCAYDEMRLHDEDNRYIITYQYISRFKGKSIFKR